MSAAVDQGVRERPILFKMEMVRAILKGQKTQTRRPVKPPRSKKLIYDLDDSWIDGSMGHQYVHIAFRHRDDPPTDDTNQERVYCPYGSPGDRLWVKETWRFQKSHIDGWKSNCALAFKAGRERGRVTIFPYGLDDPKDQDERWRPSIFMPRDYSRVLLQIQSVRIERVREIGEEDAQAEGFKNKKAFLALWDQMYPTSSPYSGNPLVWRIRFRRIDSNGKPMGPTQ